MPVQPSAWPRRERRGQTIKFFHSLTTLKFIKTQFLSHFKLVQVSSLVSCLHWCFFAFLGLLDEAVVSNLVLVQIWSLLLSPAPLPDVLWTNMQLLTKWRKPPGKKWQKLELILRRHPQKFTTTIHNLEIRNLGHDQIIRSILDHREQSRNTKLQNIAIQKYIDTEKTKIHSDHGGKYFGSLLYRVFFLTGTPLKS